MKSNDVAAAFSGHTPMMQLSNFPYEDCRRAFVTYTETYTALEPI